jgi:hypothetical protein
MAGSAPNWKRTHSLEDASGFRREISPILAQVFLRKGFSRHRHFESTPLRHTVFAFRGSLQSSPEIRVYWAQFVSLTAPETGEFEPRREDFGVLSLF